jgi:hypothetical protein
MTTTYNLPPRTAERGALAALTQPVTHYTRIAVVLVAGASASATYLDERMQFVCEQPFAAPLAAGPPFPDRENVDNAHEAPAATERPSEALFKRLATENPHALVTWSQQTDLPRGLIARAAEALGHVADHEVAVPALLALLDRDDLVVKEGALNGLARHPLPDVVGRVRAVMEDERNHYAIRDIAREVLADFDDG